MISVGIDIGKNSVKVAEIQSFAKTFSLINFKEYSLSPDPAADTRLEVVEVLRSITKLHDPGSTKYVVGIPQNRVSLRRRDFPFRERHKVVKSLAFELEDDIPFSFENAIFDAKITHYVDNSANVIALACPNEHIEEMIELCQDGGFEPDLISVEGLAFSNLFEDWLAPANSFSSTDDKLPDTAPADVIIDLGHTNTLVAIYRDSILLEIRTIDWGGRDLATSIANQSSIHYLEALKEMKLHGEILSTEDGASPDQKKMSEAIKKGMDGFIRELNLTLLEIKSQYNVDFRQANMVGGLSQIKNIGLYITQQIEVPTNRIHNLRSIPHLDLQINPTSEGVMATAVGLAIEGLKRPVNPPINLLQGEFAKQSLALREAWEKWSHTAKILAATFVLLLAYGIMKNMFAESMELTATEQLKDHVKKLTPLKGLKASSPRQIKKHVKKQKIKMKGIEAAEKLQHYNSAMDIVTKLSQIKPDKSFTQMNVKSLNINKDLVKIQGELSRASALKTFENSLKSIARDGTVKAVNPDFQNSPGWRSFAFTFLVERNPGAKK